MNKARRKLVSEAFDLVDKAKGILEDVKSAEREAYDNLPESFQNGGRGEEMQECIEMIEEGFNLLDDAASVIEQI